MASRFVHVVCTVSVDPELNAAELDKSLNLLQEFTIKVTRNSWSWTALRLKIGLSECKVERYHDALMHQPAYSPLLVTQNFRTCMVQDMTGVTWCSYFLFFKVVNIYPAEFWFLLMTLWKFLNYQHFQWKIIVFQLIGIVDSRIITLIMTEILWNDQFPCATYFHDIQENKAHLKREKKQQQKTKTKLWQ